MHQGALPKQHHQRQNMTSSSSSSSSAIVQQPPQQQSRHNQNANSATGNDSNRGGGGGFRPPLTATQELQRSSLFGGHGGLTMDGLDLAMSSSRPTTSSSDSYTSQNRYGQQQQYRGDARRLSVDSNRVIDRSTLNVVTPAASSASRLRRAPRVA